MHKAKLSVDKVKIQMKTLALTDCQIDMFCPSVLSDREALAELHTREYTNQTVTDLISLRDCPRFIFFGLLRRIQVDIRSPFSIRKLLSVISYLIRYHLRKLTECLVTNPQARQKPIHTPEMAYRREIPTKQNPVKTCYTPDDAARMPLHKSLHGFPPADLVGKPNHAKESHGASSFWLRPKAALCLCGSAVKNASRLADLSFVVCGTLNPTIARPGSPQKFNNYPLTSVSQIVTL